MTKEKRYSPSKHVKSIKNKISGNPDTKHIIYKYRRKKQLKYANVNA